MPSGSYCRLESLTSVWVSLALAALVWSLSPLPALAQQGGRDLEIWSDPQIRLPIPQGWHRLEASWVAERILIATPVPVSASELFDGDEIDVPAIVHVKIDALDPLLQGMPLDKIADGMIEEHSTRLKEAQLEFEVLARGERRTGGRPSVAVTTRQDSTINHALFVRTQGYLYEVTLAYELEHAAVYEGLADQIFDGVELKSIDAGSISMEPRETLLARLAAPRGWHEHTVEGGLPQVVISKENTVSTGGRYRTGISLLKITEYRRAFNLSDSATLDDVYGLWLQSYVSGMTGVPYRLLQAGEIVLDSGVSLLIEASFEDRAAGHFTQLFNVVTAVGDDFYIATFEAPVDEFYLLRPAYLESIAGLRWR